ncbi:mucin-3A [Caretta caretta]|uniref:mucin-3A n=1 Tax=Caretta caretta TaxID=8467 RepID=UPI003F4C001E
MAPPLSVSTGSSVPTRKPGTVTSLVTQTQSSSTSTSVTVPTKIPGTSSHPTNPTGTTTTAVPATTLEPLRCQNGGTPLANKCLCLSGFTGERCETVMNNINIDVVKAEINVTVVVTNMNFSESMEDPTSTAFKVFVEIFRTRMDPIYRETVPGFLSIEVIQLSKGSVVVDQHVVLDVPYASYASVYTQAVANVSARLKATNCTSSSTSTSPAESQELCFKANATHVNTVPLMMAGVCLNNSTISQSYQKYFLPVNVLGQLMCVSNCSIHHPDTYACNGRGYCYIQLGGPTCYCQHSDWYWFTGSHCEQVVSKVGVAVGVALGLVVLLLVILVLAICLGWRRHWSGKHSVADLEESQEKWYNNEEWEWNAPPQGITARTPTAPSWTGNIPGTEGGTGSHRVSSSFRPSLDKVDTSLQTQIARPQVTRI